METSGVMAPSTERVAACAAFALIIGLLTAGALSGCDDTVRGERFYCVTDSECQSPRTCNEGVCEWPPELDAGDIEIEIPPPVECFEFQPAVVEMTDARGGFLSSRLTRLVNCGETDVSFEDFELAGDSPRGIFSVETADDPISTFAPGDSVLVRITAAPEDAARGGVTVIAHGDVQDAVAEVTLVAAARPDPCVTFAPTVVDFGERLVVTEDRPFSARAVLQNCGELPITFDSQTVDGSGASMFGVADLTGIELKPARTRTVNVTFTPTEGGTFDATLSLGAGDYSAELPLTGIGIPREPCLSVDPDSVNFGAIPSGTVAQRTVQLENCGALPLRLDGASFIGDPLFVATAAPRSLAPGSRAPVTFSVDSELYGFGTYNGVWTVAETLNDDVDGARVDLQVEINSRPLRCVEFVDDVFDFGVVDINGVGSQQGVTLRNCGIGTVVVDGMSIDGTGYRVDNTVPISIPPNEERDVLVSFLPRQERRYDATLNIAGPSGVTDSVELTGVGVEPPVPCLSGDGGVINLGRVSFYQPFPGEPPLDLTRELTLQFANCGDTPLTTGPTSLTPLPGTPNGVFVLTDSAPPGGGTVGVGERLALTIFIDPPGAGGYATRVEATTQEAPPVTVTVQIEYVELERIGPRIDVSPLDILFGEINSGDRRAQSVVVCNIGDTPLLIDDVEIEGVTGGPAADDPFLINPPDRDSLDPGECTVFTVFFRPGDDDPGPVDWSGRVRVSSSDPATPEVFVDVSGRVLGPVPNPCLAVDEDALFFGPMSIGDSDTQTVRVRNCGNVPINVTSVATERAVSAGFSIDLDGAGLPGALQPGGFADIDVTFEAVQAGLFQDALAIASTYEGQPLFRVALDALVESDDLDCNNITAGAATAFGGPYLPAVEVALGETVFLDSGFSDFDTVNVTWTPTLFPGSNAPPLAATNVHGRRSFVPGNEGVYRFEMVFDGGGDCFGTAAVQVNVTFDGSLSAGIRLVLTWRTPDDPNEFRDPGTDIDLHFTRRDQRGVRWNNNNDCYYANRSGADWGERFSSVDDPRLLRDELDGLGPEVIVLQQPAADEELYVGVHYYSDDGLGASNATLRIFRDGVQVADAIRTIQRTNDVWVAAKITNSGQTVELLDGPNYRGFPPQNIP